MMMDITPIEESGLSERTVNALMLGGYASMEAALKDSPHQLMGLPNFGRKAMVELEQWARDNGKVAGEERLRLERSLRAMKDRLELLQRDIAYTEKRLSA